MKAVSRTFLTGLAAVVPITVTLYVLWWLGSKAETLLKDLLVRILPSAERLYLPGMGIAVGAALVYLIGFFLKAWLVRYLFQAGETLLRRIPMVKTLYGSVRDLMGFFATVEEGKKERQAVTVTLGDSGIRVLGLLTRDDLSGLPGGLGSEDRVAVYVPMSYAIGGFTTMVPRSAVEPIEMSMEEAMRFAVTGGMANLEKKDS
jgi:uncharacterized membrane protein